jgi:hypothetical protein
MLWRQRRYQSCWHIDSTQYAFCKALILAHSGRASRAHECPALGVKRTSFRQAAMSADDPKANKVDFGRR